MIYIGLIHFNDASHRTPDLSAALESYTHTTPAIINKHSLTLCYGKLENGQDMDDVWENNSSILLGRPFDKARQCSFGKEDFKNFSDFNKEQVLERIWGKYVYINGNIKTSQFEVVVDSTGQLPFFYYPFPDGNILFSSDIEIIFKVLGQKPDYNWEYLCSYLIYGNSSAIKTPFKNIYELPPACYL